MTLGELISLIFYQDYVTKRDRFYETMGYEVKINGKSFDAAKDLCFNHIEKVVELGDESYYEPEAP